MNDLEITKQNGNIENKKICGIYCISNSKYFYIGQSRNIKSRWTNHKSKLSANKHENKFMQRVYNKHKDNDPFNYEIILECETRDLTFLESETLLHFIKKYPEKKSMNLADPFNIRIFDETIKKQKKSHTGKVFSEEHKKNISKGQQGKLRPNKRIKIVQLDLEGNLIHIWDGGLTEAKLVTNINVSLSRKTSGGFQWQKYDDWLENPKGAVSYNTTKKIEQYDLNGSLIKCYNSIQEASNETEIKHCNISNAANGIQKTAGGFIWKYQK